MAVPGSSSVAKTGPTISGNFSRIVIIKLDPGYRGATSMGLIFSAPVLQCATVKSALDKSPGPWVS
jgi:hypothetical protein